MGKVAENRDKQPVDDSVRAFVSILDDEHKMLVVLKAQLYGGQWETMLDDLKNRLEGKPYIFKLSSRIKEDVERIERMRDFEEEQGIDLSDYVELS